MAVSVDSYNKFCTEFYLSDYSEVLRFGQAFCNEFNITNSVLFYEKSLIKAKVIIFDKYVMLT